MTDGGDGQRIKGKKKQDQKAVPRWRRQRKSDAYKLAEAQLDQALGGDAEVRMVRCTSGDSGYKDAGGRAKCWVFCFATCVAINLLERLLFACLGG